LTKVNLSPLQTAGISLLSLRAGRAVGPVFVNTFSQRVTSVFSLRTTQGLFLERRDLLTPIYTGGDLPLVHQFVVAQLMFRSSDPQHW